MSTSLTCRTPVSPTHMYTVMSILGRANYSSFMQGRHGIKTQQIPLEERPQLKF